MTTFEDDYSTKCHCGEKFTIVYGACCTITCPTCGSPVKVGACE